ncbi:uncharacterized protein LOC108911510 [Anoplophora glabripennis]|uniref:uncharacterized protein LOC108911510 n=1 Tax=Anoplophora glabripennis TaxID=217634 RepID=UPI0008737B02|nr:uncharacterized protein LOC108911510 [Anoplophora glabripennis]
MKHFVLILVCCLVAVGAYVETILVSNNHNPVGLTYCYSEMTGAMEKGEEISLEGECRKATCEKNGRIIIRKCTNIPISPCGILAADFTRSFPLCCPQPRPCSAND